MIKLRKIIIVAYILILIIMLGACKVYNVEGLTIPTKEEAKEMTKQPSFLAAGTVMMIRPESYDLKLAIEKGLCGLSGFGDKYLYMQAMYRKALEQYFMDVLTLEEFETQIKNHEFNYLPIPEEKKEFYQKYSTMPLDYIYLRSNLPIERLSKEDLAILEQLINAGRSDITEELAEMVVRTYPVVIRACTDRDDDIPASFAATNAKNAPNLSVAFEVNYALFDESGYFLHSAEENEQRENYILEDLLPEMSQTLSEQLDFTVVVFLGLY